MYTINPVLNLPFERGENPFLKGLFLFIRIIANYKIKLDKYVTDENGQFTTKEYVCDTDWTIREAKTIIAIALVAVIVDAFLYRDKGSYSSGSRQQKACLHQVPQKLQHHLSSSGH